MEDEIIKSAQAILRNSPYRDLRNIQLLMVSGTLMLIGTVRSYHQKQLAFHALEGKVNGIPIKTDLLKVEDPRNT